MDFGEDILSVSLDDAISIVAHELRSPYTAPSAATRLLERLRLGLEDEVGTRKLVRTLHRLMPTPPHPTVSEQLLEMLPMLVHPTPVVEELSLLLGPNLDGSALTAVVDAFVNGNDCSWLTCQTFSLYHLRHFQSCAPIPHCTNAISAARRQSPPPAGAGSPL